MSARSEARTGTAARTGTTARTAASADGRSAPAPGSARA
ncbi:hypothetical protein W824_04970 [Clavibacter cf. michiganensis LMG 26808]|nr:hypothetical protein W824_04970 [Clavibacter cf. michiganensis LMG 26808]